MKTVAKIIESYGGLDWLRKPGNYIRLENPPYMRLVIEHIGQGPRGLPVIAVAHYYEQNGDAMRDPEIVFEVNPDVWKTGEWTPVSYRQDNLDIYHEAVYLIDTGKPMIRPKLLRHLKAFAREWDRNIEQQGFLNAARSQGGAA